MARVVALVASVGTLATIACNVTVTVATVAADGRAASMAATTTTAALLTVIAIRSLGSLRMVYTSGGLDALASKVARISTLVTHVITHSFADSFVRLTLSNLNPIINKVYVFRKFEFQKYIIRAFQTSCK
jgi:hypothetical protein